jgi:hypothetical protein
MDSDAWSVATIAVRALTYLGQVAVALGIATAPLAAQDRCGPEELVPWGSRFVGDGVREFPPAERAIVDANLKAAEEMVRKTNYGTPRGFAVRPSWSYGDRTRHPLTWGTGNPTRNPVLWYQYATIVYHACSKYDEYGSGFTIQFNPDPQAWSESDRPRLDENGDALYTERRPIEPLFGSTATYGHLEAPNSEGIFILFTSGGASPTIPVTREEYLRAVILSLEGKNQEKVKEVLEFTSKTQYERWKERAAERKRDIEQIVAGIAQVDPAKAAKARADLENGDRVAGETHLKNEPAERAELDKIRANATAPGDRIRARIAAMNPAERASPAYVVDILDVVPAGTPDANAIVRVNPDFYRTRRTPLEPRVILVRIPLDERLPAQRRQLIREFDWDALKRLLVK